MGLPYSVLPGSIRFSLSRYTTQGDIEQVLTVLPDIVDRLRAISPFNSDDADWLKEQEQAVLTR
jgi:cysteine desulfurase